MYALYLYTLECLLKHMRKVLFLHGKERLATFFADRIREKKIERFCRINGLSIKHGIDFRKVCVMCGMVDSVCLVEKETK